MPLASRCLVEQGAEARDDAEAGGGAVGSHVLPHEHGVWVARFGAQDALAQGGGLHLVLRTPTMAV